MTKMSRRRTKQLLRQVDYCRKTGDNSTAIAILKNLIADDRKALGIYTPKLRSKSAVEVPQRVEVTKSNQAYYNQGDYYYSDLNVVFKRK